MGRALWVWARALSSVVNAIQGVQQPGARLLQQACIGDVVDVHGGAGEVQEFQVRVVAQLFADVVLHGLDIVAGLFLYALDGTRVNEDVRGGCADVLYGGLGSQGVQPFQFNGDALSDQCSLAEQLAEFPGLCGVAPVQGRQGIKGRGWGSGHESGQWQR